MKLSIAYLALFGTAAYAGRPQLSVSRVDLKLAFALVEPFLNVVN
jgi:hypothetical protein